MAYIPPHYGPRDDWRQVLRNGGGGNNVNSWQVDMVLYFGFTEDRHLSPRAAWDRVGMSYDHATKACAFSLAPPTPRNESGLIPPAIAAYVFARSLADSVDFTHLPTLVPDHSIHVDRDAKEPAFKPPRYRPRADWQQRLESMQPADGSWQADLVRYWRMRRDRTSEDQAWEAVAMTPANARQALVEDEESDDAGLIPCLPDGKETVARRILARSAATGVDRRDIYSLLILEPRP